MFKIYPNGIVVTKGDTVKMPITVLNDDGTVYDVQPLDTISFHLKETFDDEECLIELTIDNDELMLNIPHDETKKLEVGKHYLYELKLTKENGDVNTFTQSKLKVTDAVCVK